MESEVKSETFAIATNDKQYFALCTDGKIQLMNKTWSTVTQFHCVLRCNESDDDEYVEACINQHYEAALMSHRFQTPYSFIYPGTCTVPSKGDDEDKKRCEEIKKLSKKRDEEFEELKKKYSGKELFDKYKKWYDSNINKYYVGIIDFVSNSKPGKRFIIRGNYLPKNKEEKFMAMVYKVDHELYNSFVKFSIENKSDIFMDHAPNYIIGWFVESEDNSDEE